MFYIPLWFVVLCLDDYFDVLINQSHPFLYLWSRLVQIICAVRVDFTANENIKILSSVSPAEFHQSYDYFLPFPPPPHAPLAKDELDENWSFWCRFYYFIFSVSTAPKEPKPDLSKLTKNQKKNQKKKAKKKAKRQQELLEIQQQQLQVRFQQSHLGFLAWTKIMLLAGTNMFFFDRFVGSFFLPYGGLFEDVRDSGLYGNWFFKICVYHVRIFTFVGSLHTYKSMLHFTPNRPYW